MSYSSSNDGQPIGTHKRLLLGLIACCAVLVIAAATLANMYYEQTRITHALTLQGDQPQKPIKPYSFQLPTSSYGSVQWTLEGPANTIAASAELNFSKSIKATQDQRIYQIVGHDFKVTDPTTGAQQELEFPDNFPSLPWPMGVAYDSKRHYVSLFSLGGEGFIYRYDTRTGQWLDFRSLSNIDVRSISYDESTDRYVGWTTDGGIAVIDGEGTPRYTRHLADRLPGYKRLYDTGNSRPPNVMVVPRGEQMVLVLPQGGEGGVFGITMRGWFWGS